MSGLGVATPAPEIDRHRRGRTVVLVVGVLVLAAAALVGSRRHHLLPVDLGAADGSWPSSAYEPLSAATPEDLVSFADAVAVVTVTGEHRLADPTTADGAEGYVGRRVDVTVDELVWSSPERPTPPTHFSMTTSGWIRHDGEDRPTSFNQAVRLEVGGRYLIALVESGEGWVQQSSRAVVAVDAAGTIERPRAAGALTPQVAHAFDSVTTVEEVRTLLEATPPSPWIRGVEDRNAFLRSAFAAGARDHRPGEDPAEAARRFLAEVAADNGIPVGEIVRASGG